MLGAFVDTLLSRADLSVSWAFLFLKSAVSVLV